MIKDKLIKMPGPLRTGKTYLICWRFAGTRRGAGGR